MSVSAAREALATALESIEGITVYAYPPENVTPPAIVILPDEPYLEPITIGRDGTRIRASFRITLLSVITDNQSNLESIEGLAAAVYSAVPKEFQLGPTSSPDVGKVGGANFLFAEISVQTSLTL